MGLTLSPEQLRALEAKTFYYKEQLRRRHAVQRELKAEEAAAQPPPILVFDGEEVLESGKWLIGGVIPAEGAGHIFGETDVGKTFIALSMGVSVAGNRSWYGHDVDHGTVLFIETEGGRDFALRKHAAKIEAGVYEYLPDKPFPFVTIYESLNFGPDTDPALVLTRARAIREAVANRAYPPIRFVVADTLSQNIKGNADDNEHMSLFLRHFRAFIRALSIEPVFGLLIHHPGHADKTRGRGAYALPADLDLIMKLEGTPDQLLLTCGRQRTWTRFAPIPLALESRFVTLDDGQTTTTLVVVSRAADQVRKPDKTAEQVAQIVAYLRLHPEKTTAQIAGDLRIAKATVVDEVDNLVASTVLHRIETRGKTGQLKQTYVVNKQERVEAATEPDAVSEL
jgi:hypothetical protein